MIIVFSSPLREYSLLILPVVKSINSFLGQHPHEPKLAEYFTYLFQPEPGSILMVPDDWNLNKLHLSSQLESLDFLATLLSSDAHLASPEPFLVLRPHSDTIDRGDARTECVQDGDAGGGGDLAGGQGRLGSLQLIQSCILIYHWYETGGVCEV